MSKKSPIVWTEKQDCQDCYRCLRECVVKAIKFEDSSASIIDDLCIFCGHCALICPLGVKKTRNDIPKVQKLLRSGKKVIVSLAPSYITEFPDSSPAQMISALKKCGFWVFRKPLWGQKR